MQAYWFTVDPCSDWWEFRISEIGGTTCFFLMHIKSLNMGGVGLVRFLVEWIWSSKGALYMIYFVGLVFGRHWPKHQITKI